MDREAFDAFCLSLPAVTTEILWGVDQVYKVGGRMFAVLGPQDTVSFKASDIAFEMLTDGGPGRPAPYMARAKWVFFDRLDAVPREDLESHLRTAHDLIAAKLTRKSRAQLGLA